MANENRERERPESKGILIAKRGQPVVKDPNMEIPGSMRFKVVNGKHHDSLSGNTYCQVVHKRGAKDPEGNPIVEKEADVFQSGKDLTKLFGRKFEKLESSAKCNAPPDGFALRLLGFTVLDIPKNPRLQGQSEARG